MKRRDVLGLLGVSPFLKFSRAKTEIDKLRLPFKPNPKWEFFGVTTGDQVMLNYAQGIRYFKDGTDWYVAPFDYRKIK